MSFLAKLTIEDVEMNVLECSFEFIQSIDSNGRPTGRPRGGLIHILIESTNSTDFLAWMVSPGDYKDGEIVFYKRDIMSSNKTLHFTDAFCVGYLEQFDAENSLPMRTKLTISARAMGVNGSEYENPWESFH
tara:strand:- start:53947 stop:54342 length:396 start_codon:yes stop_codon:yes gene_type:complete